MSENQGYEDEVLPEQTSDDTDRGWGDDRGERKEREDDDERILRERPPHW
jgi:hypothetical protein